MKSIIVPNQYGFMSGRSTSLNLLKFQNDVLEAFSCGYQVDCIYLDFSKAFDRVDHQILIHKLWRYGVQGKMLDWFNDYLSERVNFVKVKNCVSKQFETISGVPQGSHLGPFLFLLFINDVGDALRDVNYLLFADDLKVYRIIKDASDSSELQLSLNKLHEWVDTNNLSFNVNKCKFISYHRSRDPFLFDYYLKNARIERIFSVKDLGVVFKFDMSFNLHYDFIIGKAFKMLGFVFRNTRSFKSAHCLKVLYCALVRPILEYCAIIWNPYHATHIKNLERIQNKFVKRLKFRGVYGTEKLELLSLESRRRNNYLIFAFKLLNNLVDSSDLLNCFNFYVPPRSLRQPSLFYVNLSMTDFLKNSPVNRIMEETNKFCALHDCDIFNVDFSNFKLLMFKAST